MLRLIHADLYKIFHRFYFYIMAASLAALCVLVNLVLRTAGQYSAASFSWGFAVSMLSAPVFLMPMLTDIVRTVRRCIFQKPLLPSFWAFS
ncbi:MAG: hypothetical protein LKJ73_08250 [Oscillospiraceae bacterium]|nr:hypothetical protein [Oscillospiraceae bacterium]